MSDLPVFLGLVRDAPDDDGPRLVFADWLEENGQPGRAEFVRVQCDLARWEPDLERRDRLLEREAELLAEHRSEWLGPLARHASACCFRRGTVAVTAGGRVRPEEADSPWVQEVRLAGEAQADSAWMTALRGRLLRHLHSLDLSGGRFVYGPLSHLAESPAFAGLRSLDLRNKEGFDPADLRGFHGWPFAHLRSLRLDGNFTGLLGDRIEADVPWFADYEPTPPGEEPPVLLNSVGMRLTRIPAGTFRMGTPPEEPGHEADEEQHRVTITRPFYLGTCPVTQEQYERVTGTNPSRFTAASGGGPHHPVEQVSWEEAVEFCRALSALPAERAAGRIYRLPREAEWEYACRAGTTRAFSSGKSLGPGDANFLNHLPSTTPVGSYPPNDFGLYDLHGNVREWCADWYARDYYAHSPEEDPPGPPKGSSRVLRGGSWDVAAAAYCRCGYRVYFSPTGRLAGIGFRVACRIG